MRKSGTLLLLLACLPGCLYAQKTRFSQSLPRAKPGVTYPIKVHISAIWLGTQYVGRGTFQRVVHADAVLNGEKVELTGQVELRSDDYDIALLPGEYQARLFKDPRKEKKTPLFQEYEVLFPDGTVWRGSVMGVAE